MPTPHPTLRFSDLRSTKRQRLAALHAPQRLHLTHNARGAFYQLLRSLPVSERRTVVLPAFHCTALVEPAARAGYDVSFYRVRPDFSVDFDDVRARMSPKVAVLLAIHYFGFPVDMAPFRELAKQHGSFVVEDCAHSFLSRVEGGYVGHGGDFALFSYYKFAPSLAGGGLGINLSEYAGSFTKHSLPLRERLVIGKRLLEWMFENSPRNPVSRAFLALERRRVSAKQAAPADTAPSRFVDDPYLFREDLALASMPGICRRVLESCHWEIMKQARQRNYRRLAKLLRSSRMLRPVFPELPENVCPWAFPVLLEDRLAHEHRLRAQGVPLFTFGEVLHPLLAGSHDAAREDAEYLSRRLLLLPVHPQLSESDIHQIAERTNRFVSELEVSESSANLTSAPSEHSVERIGKGSPA